jgi:hypothetical protein
VILLRHWWCLRIRCMFIDPASGVDPQWKYESGSGLYASYICVERLPHEIENLYRIASCSYSCFGFGTAKDNECTPTSIDGS